MPDKTSTYLYLQSCRSAHRVGQKHQRWCDYAVLGHEWWDSDDPSLLEEREGDHYHIIEQGGMDVASYTYGVLSEVNSRRARYGGLVGHIRLTATDETLHCGPQNEPPCPKRRISFIPLDDCGTFRACGKPGGNSTGHVCISMADKNGHILEDFCHHPCDDPCPPELDKTIQNDVESLADYPLWQEPTPTTPQTPLAGIYRSYSSCLEDLHTYGTKPQPLRQSY